MEIIDRFNLYRKDFQDNKNLRIPILLISYLLVISISAGFYLRTGFDFYTFSFELVKIIYFLILVTFIYVLFTNWSTEFFQKHDFTIVFTGCVLFFSFYAPLGIDLTDEGKQMSIAYFLFNGNIDHNYNYYKLGAWLINGAWLNIVSFPFLFIERIGGVLLVSFMGVTIYKIFTFFSTKIHSLIAFIPAYMMAVARNHPETKIDHNNLPTLILFISMLLMIYYYSTIIRTGKKKYLLLTFSSLIYQFSIFTRFPHITFYIAPFLFFILDYLFNHKKKKQIVNEIVFYYLLPLIPVIIAIFGLMYSGFISMDIFYSLFGKLSSHFSGDGAFTDSYLFRLLKIYGFDTFRLVVFIAGFFVFVIGSYFIKTRIIEHKFIKDKFNDKIISFSEKLALMIVIMAFMLIQPWSYYTTVLSLIFLFIVYVMFHLRYKINEEKMLMFFLFFYGPIIYFVSFVGSNNSFSHSFPSGAVTFVFGAVLLVVLKYDIFKKDKFAVFVRYITILFFIVTVVFALGKKTFNNAKRDGRIETLDTMFRSRELWGIISQKNRVEVLDDIILKSKELIPEDSTLICFNYIPMLHYILSMDYYLDDPWIYQINPERLSESLSQKELVDYIIYAKRCAREEKWPDTEVMYGPKYGEEIKKIIDNYVEQNQYINIYENDAFYIYKAGNL